MRLYLPAISVGPVAGGAVEAPAVEPQAVVEFPIPPRSVAPLPEPPTAAPPLQFPDPRSDVPRFTVRARSARLPTPAPRDESQGAVAGSPDDTPAAAAEESPSLLAAGVEGLALSPEAVPAEIAPADQAERWIWPVQGEISQFFSEGHRAIDVVTEHGEVVVAADGGEVVYAEWEISGFGYLVIVDHGDSYRTYYGHLYGFYVDVGQVVERGELVGQLGNTGNSTGPHLHFEIRQWGVSRDPLKLLPSGRR